jgi:hypothetical protein
MCLDLIKNLFGKKEVKPVSIPANSTDAYWGNPPLDVNKPIWTVVKISPNGIIVKYQEKYGAIKQEECIGLWENEKQYLLTWKTPKNVILQKENIVSIDAQPK